MFGRFKKKVEPKCTVILKDALPKSSDPDDDGFDDYRLALAMEVMRTGRTSVGEMDDKGNLFIRPFE